MSEMLGDILATDAQLDLIRCGAYVDPDDLTLTSLAELAWAVDADPIPVSGSVPARPPVTRAHKGGLALAATVALVLSSSGVAAAVCGDALAPLHYVTKQVLRIGPHQSAQLPGWDLDGSMPISTVEDPHLVVRGGQGAPRTATIVSTQVGPGHHSTGHSGQTGPPGAAPGAPSSGGGGPRPHNPAGGEHHDPHGRPPGETGPADPVAPIHHVPPGGEVHATHHPVVGRHHYRVPPMHRRAVPVSSAARPGAADTPATQDRSVPASPGSPAGPAGSGAVTAGSADASGDAAGLVR